MANQLRLLQLQQLNPAEEEALAVLIAQPVYQKYLQVTAHNLLVEGSYIAPDDTKRRLIQQAQIEMLDFMLQGASVAQLTHNVKE